jgi:hypothetical protein
VISGFVRVTRRTPCPICGKPDWCLIAQDGKRFICARAESPRRFGDAGWLHESSDAVAFKPIPKRREESSIDFSEMWRKWMLETTTGVLAKLANDLGVSRESLRSIGAVWADHHGAWAFPMRDGATNTIIGIRLRSNGDKWAVKGSNGSGIFIPQKTQPDTRLIVCEGPTDCAALLDRDYFVIGRPSCSSGTQHVVSLVRRIRPREIVIFADADGPGLRGAEMLADEIWIPTRIVAPPRHKDARAWIGAGACRGAIEAVISAANYFRRKRSA